MITDKVIYIIVVSYTPVCESPVPPPQLTMGILTRLNILAVRTPSFPTFHCQNPLLPTRRGIFDPFILSHIRKHLCNNIMSKAHEWVMRTLSEFHGVSWRFTLTGAIRECILPKSMKTAVCFKGKPHFSLL